MALIALSGPVYSGKTTLARELGSRGYTIIQYNDLLKEMAAKALTRALGKRVTVEDILADKRRYRAFLIELGNLAGFNEGYGLAKIARRVKREKQTDVVLDNVRFDAQWAILKRYGWHHVRLYLDQPEQWERAEAVGMDYKAFYDLVNSPSENGIASASLALDATMPADVNADILERVFG